VQVTLTTPQDAPPVAAEIDPALYGKTAYEKRRRILTLGFVACVVISILITSTRWGTTGIAGDLFFLAGVTLAMTGCLGRLWSGLFIAGYKSRELITCGPYALCRNPLYFFSAIGLIGIGLMACTLTVPLVFAVAFAVYYPTIIASEEVRLQGRHGAAFEDYCRTTPAFWPRFRAYHEPETYLIHLQPLRRNFVDAAWFVLLAVFVHIAAELHTRGFLPTVFTAW